MGELRQASLGGALRRQLSESDGNRKRQAYDETRASGPPTELTKAKGNREWLLQRKRPRGNGPTWR
eukprot:scaffold15150_cov32-Tisochrysis_lutea.AAC.8